MPAMPQTRPKVLLIESRSAPAGRTETALEALLPEPELQAWEFVRADRLAGIERVLREHLFSAILVDLHLSDADGLDAYRRLRALAPGLPILAVAEPREITLAEAAVNEGAQACLPRGSITGVTLDWALRQALLRSRAEGRRFRALFDSAPTGILLASGRKIAMANSAALETLGYGQAELARLSVVDLFPPEHRDLVAKALDSAAAAGDVGDLHLQTSLRRADGGSAACHAYLKGALLNDAPAVSMYLAFAEEGPEIQRARKLDAMGRMAAVLAHDFNNLLTAINGYAEHLLSLPGGQAGPVEQGLMAIRRAGESAATLMRGLGDFSHPGSEQPRDIRVDAAIDQMAPTLSSLLGRAIELRIRPGAGQAAVRLETGQLEQVILNLVANARDALPRGGSVTLATGSAESVEHEAFTHLAAGPGPHVFLEIGDSGAGIEAETLERLFEPFFTTKPAARGAGLGLSAVYGIVHQAGGGLSVFSEPGRGSRFRVFFPRADEARAPSTRAAPASVAVPPTPPGSGEAPAASPEARRENARRNVQASVSSVLRTGGGSAEARAGTVLVVEDEPTLREMLGTMLKRFGYAALETVSEAEAVKAAAAHPEIDLVITDITLRESYGHEMMDRLRLLRPGLPALFVSGHPLDYLAEQGIRLPPELFLEKPFTPSQLALKVREVLGARKSA